MQNLQVWLHWTSKTGLGIGWWWCQFLIHFSNPIPESQEYAGSLSTSTGQPTWAGVPCIQPSSARPRTLNRTLQQASHSTWNLNPTGSASLYFSTGILLEHGFNPYVQKLPPFKTMGSWCCQDQTEIWWGKHSQQGLMNLFVLIVMSLWTLMAYKFTTVQITVLFKLHALSVPAFLLSS